ELLLEAYGSAGRLYGHGVELSLLSADFSDRQRAWLRRLEREMRERRYQHFSEHYGFMTAGRFTNGTPLPVPLTSESIAVGREHYQMLHATLSCPLGLENLAFAFGPRDVEDQPIFNDSRIGSRIAR